MNNCVQERDVLQSVGVRPIVIYLEKNAVMNTHCAHFSLLFT